MGIFIASLTVSTFFYLTKVVLTLPIRFSQVDLIIELSVLELTLQSRTPDNHLQLFTDMLNTAIFNIGTTCMRWRQQTCIVTFFFSSLFSQKATKSRCTKHGKKLLSDASNPALPILVPLWWSLKAY